jgi:TonB family protein
LRGHEKEEIMKAWLAGWVVVAAIVSGKAQANQEETRQTFVTWKLFLDADGKVTKLSTKDKTAPLLHETMESAIRDWKFNPGTVKGKSAPTRTWLTTKIEVSVVDQQVKLKVLHAATGPAYDQIKIPRYPDRALQNRIEGVVVLNVKFDGAGKVVRIAPYEFVDKAPEKILLQAALSSVRKWTFATEHVAGIGVASSALVPACFSASQQSKPNACEWKDTASGARGDGDGLVAIDPAARLLTDVTGKVM